MAEKLTLAFGGGKRGQDFYTHKPKVVSASEAAKELVGKKKIMFITGAGLSAASGIPTFRGDNGFWSKSYGGVTDPTEVLTYRFFGRNPALVWQWHFDFIELTDKCKPNKGHYALLKFMEHCHQSAGKVDCHMITQNIDDYDAQLVKESKVLTPAKVVHEEGTPTFAFTPFIYEMHGNVKYMHCSEEEKECGRNFYLAPTLKDVKDRTNHVPLCKDCGAPMKPHAMFFDESYSEHYYRDATNREWEQSMDALIVIGTALATGGARSLVNRALGKKEIPVFEFNMEPCLDEGYAIQVTEKCETALNNFFNEYYRLTAQPSSHQVKQGASKAVGGVSQAKTSPKLVP